MRIQIQTFNTLYWIFQHEKLIKHDRNSTRFPSVEEHISIIQEVILLVIAAYYSLLMKMLHKCHTIKEHTLKYQMSMWKMWQLSKTGNISLYNNQPATFNVRQ